MKIPKEVIKAGAERMSAMHKAMHAAHLAMGDYDHDALTAAIEAHKQARAAQDTMEAAAKRRGELVREAHAAGHSVTEIAEALGVHRSRVYHMIGQ